MKNSILFSFFIFFSLFAEEQTPIAFEKKIIAHSIDVSLVSESFGYIINKNLKDLGIPFNMTQIIKGIQDAVEGKSPPISERELIHIFTSVQEKNFPGRCQENLENAETFLTNNAKNEKVICIENGKVQYRILKEGTGKSVKPHFTPFIRYTVNTLDGFISNDTSEEGIIYLKETIPGLKAGLIGMKEGEKRIIHIHPNLAYGTKECSLPPNVLLIFEVEILKVNAS